MRFSYGSINGAQFQPLARGNTAEKAIIRGIPTIFETLRGEGAGRANLHRQRSRRHRRSGCVLLGSCTEGSRTTACAGCTPKGSRGRRRGGVSVGIGQTLRKTSEPRSQGSTGERGEAPGSPPRRFKAARQQVGKACGAGGLTNRLCPRQFLQQKPKKE